MQRLFRGRAVYATVCGACGGASAASATPVDWYELELNVKGFSGLGASLADYLAEERLEGDNRYACDSAACAGARRDATRAVRLRAAPPVLNVQLKRFVFDMKVRLSYRLSFGPAALVNCTHSLMYCSYVYRRSRARR